MNKLLPSFLKPWPKESVPQPDTPFIRSIFKHSEKLVGDVVETLYWPSKNDTSEANADNRVVLLLIPGNPGLVDFYIPFLNNLHQRINETSSRDRYSKISIIAKAHLGHSPALFDAGNLNRLGRTPMGLTSQVESAVELFDAASSHYSLSEHINGDIKRKAKVILIGHSVGAWIALQVLKERPDVHGLFLLFPTISGIGATPNGRALSWLFKPPIPAIVSRLSVTTNLIPNTVLRYLFKPWPEAQLGVLRSLISSPSTIYSTLSMANEEMKVIKSLTSDEATSDAQLLEGNTEKIWFYFAEKDNWVGMEREVILKIIHKESEDGNVRVVNGQEGVPHSFCITHSELVAEQCALWLDNI